MKDRSRTNLSLLFLGFMNALLEAFGAALTTAVKFLLAFNFLVSHEALLIDLFNLFPARQARQGNDCLYDLAAPSGNFRRQDVQIGYFVPLWGGGNLSTSGCPALERTGPAVGEDRQFSPVKFIFIEYFFVFWQGSCSCKNSRVLCAAKALLQGRCLLSLLVEIAADCLRFEH